ICDSVATSATADRRSRRGCEQSSEDQPRQVRGGDDMRRSKRNHRRMAKRGYGTGQLYLKHGAYYGRWRTLDGRKLNRRIGAVRDENVTGGLTRTEAERQFRKLQEAEERRPMRGGAARHTLDEASGSLRRRLAVEGARKSYLQN